jgi:hypothetical protein
MVPFTLCVAKQVCLEHMLKMAASSIQALLYASLQIREEIW